MGTGRMCDACNEITSLLSSYDGRRGRSPLGSASDHGNGNEGPGGIGREEVETLLLFLQSWATRNCSCAFRDHRNHERFNWALQVLIIVATKIIQHLGTGALAEEVKEEKNRPFWDLEEKDKFLHFIAKVFSSSFPTYTAYKQHITNGGFTSGGMSKGEDLTASEINAFTQYCEVNDPEASPFLFRNITLFAKSGGMEIITTTIKNNGPETLTLQQLNCLINLALNVKAWFNFPALLRHWVPLRKGALAYMCSLIETELNTVNARNMAEFIWSAVKDPVDAHLSFDKEGLDLALRYFLCPTLTLRLAGMGQMNGYVGMVNDLLGSEHVRDAEGLYASLISWLKANDLIQHIFGPNLHVEVIKQSGPLLSFLAMEGVLTPGDIETIWGASFLKHCSKQVFDLLSGLLPHLEPQPLLHLHSLLKQLQPKDHTEQSLYLTSALLKFIWSRAFTPAATMSPDGGIINLAANSGAVGVAIGQVSGSSSGGQSGKPRRFRGVKQPRLEILDGNFPLRQDNSSSENSLSLDEGEGLHEGSEEEEPEGGDILFTDYKKQQVAGFVRNGGGAKEAHNRGFNKMSSSSGSSSEEEDDSLPSDRGSGAGGMSSSYVETHSDSDADEERSGGEDHPHHAERGNVTFVTGRGRGGVMRKVLKRKARVNAKKVPGQGQGQVQNPPLLKRATPLQARRVPRGRGAGTSADVSIVPDVDEALEEEDEDEKENKSSRNSSGMDMSLQEPDPPLMSSEVITQLDNLLAAAANQSRRQSSSPPILNPYSGEADTSFLEGSEEEEEGDGSYSSRMSTKSEKNMADFEGEESPLEEDEEDEDMEEANALLTSTPRHELRGRFSVTGSPLLPRGTVPASRRRFGSGNLGVTNVFSEFGVSLDKITEKGQTLLWDLVQDDTYSALGEGLGVEAEKALANLLCFGAERGIRAQFILGCLRNLEQNKSVVVSLRLLPKILASFHQQRMLGPGGVVTRGNMEVSQVTLWAEKEHKMLEKFFKNLRVFFKGEAATATATATPGDGQRSSPPKDSQSPFSFQTHVHVRLEFLAMVFSSVSPDGMQLSIQQVDELWSCLSSDPRSADELFNWCSGQLRGREAHALCHLTIRHILLEKLPSLPPEDASPSALTLFTQLSSLLRFHGGTGAGTQGGITGIGTTPGVEGEESRWMDYLWGVGLAARRTEVSSRAIHFLNNFYLSASLQRETLFVSRVMTHLNRATLDVKKGMEDAPLLHIQRALLLLKSHLETFRRRFAYHLRTWALEGDSLIGSHGALGGLTDPSGGIIRVCIQPAGFHEKITLEMSQGDYVADLRAEVTKWWEKYQQSVAPTPTTGQGPTPVLGSLLVPEGPLRLITQGIELSPELDEKTLGEVPIKDLQLVFVSMGARGGSSKGQGVPCRKDLISPCSSSASSGGEGSYSIPPPKSRIPLNLLLEPSNFEQLFSLMQTLAEAKEGEVLKAQVLSRRVWEILMLLPTNPEILKGLKDFDEAEGGPSDEGTLSSLLDPSSPQKLMYSLHIVEALVKRKEDEATGTSWKAEFVKRGGLSHLFNIFMSGALEPKGGEGEAWSEWRQDCLASLLKILCYLGITVPQGEGAEGDFLSDLLSLEGGTDPPARKKWKRNRMLMMMKQGGGVPPGTQDKSPIIPKLNETMLSLILSSPSPVVPRLTAVLCACGIPRDPTHFKTGVWGRAQVIHYAMALLVPLSVSKEGIREELYAHQDFPLWLRRLVLEDPEPAVRRETCVGLYRLALGQSTPLLIKQLLQSLDAALTLSTSEGALTLTGQGQGQGQTNANDRLPPEEGKEGATWGPAARDYFWLLSRLLDGITSGGGDNLDLDGLANGLRKAFNERENRESRNQPDEGLVGLLSLLCVVAKGNPTWKASPEGGILLLGEVWEGLFALPSPSQRTLPKCKSPQARGAAYDLLAELAKGTPNNYILLHCLLIAQHTSSAHNHAPYPWDYWPADDGRASCGHVGLTNLGATCYMASSMQHLYMMPEARSAILSADPERAGNRHQQTLMEMQRMFAYLLESERKAYNPRSFCKVYEMDHKPLNTGEQKDMAEFFIDLVSKLEESGPELRALVKTLFAGVTSNNVVSLDCPHVSRTLEEFYTVRCQVADMRSLYESLDEVTVKDTLEGDNMYTCSTCGKKVRAEKRACFKTLPKVLCFNTMRYTFNMVTMQKEKVNTHFSFPLNLDMGGYLEEALLPPPPGENDNHDNPPEKKTPSPALYELIGVTVHTGTADGGHYYAFIRGEGKKGEWLLFNDAEVKPFDPSQIPGECFGGEMNTKTYDSVTEKFMDFSFEKTHSAYMLFYQRAEIEAEATPMVAEKTAPTEVTSPPTLRLRKDLEDWIWDDNTQFLRDRNIFEHTYFNFISQVCLQIPLTLTAGGGIPEDYNFLAATLSGTFFLETFIHAKERPTAVHWMDLLTKQLTSSKQVATWFLETMAEEDNSWLSTILLRCPNGMIRQLFSRLCYNVIVTLRGQGGQRPSRASSSEGDDHDNDHEGEVDDPMDNSANDEDDPLSGITPLGGEREEREEGIPLSSPISKFLMKYLSLLAGLGGRSLRFLGEYFSLLQDIARLGDGECLLLLRLSAISLIVNFYLSARREELEERYQGPLGVLGVAGMSSSRSDEERDERDENDERDQGLLSSLPAEKCKVAALERMTALVATLVEKSRSPDDLNTLNLNKEDREALLGAQNKVGVSPAFPFLLGGIREGVSLAPTRNLIFSLCRWNERLAEEILTAIFSNIQRHPEVCGPYFKVLNLLGEGGGSGGLVVAGSPPWTELILNRLLDVSELCPLPTLEWLGGGVARNATVHAWTLSSLPVWLEHFLIQNSNSRVRNAAASLLVSLVPNAAFRAGYRTTKLYSGFHSNPDLIQLSPEAQKILHEIYLKLLSLLKPARHYTDISSHGTSKLIAFFSVLTYFTLSKTEKIMFGPYFPELWALFYPRMSEPSIPCHQNKAALLSFWAHACADCPENVQRILNAPTVLKQIGFNYILADHEDHEVLLFNRSMLPAYYAILRHCVLASRTFALHLARHQNLSWAFKNISPHPAHYPAATEELFRIMAAILQHGKGEGLSEGDLQEINAFKKNTLTLYIQSLDGRSTWGTLISAFRILVETGEDRVWVGVSGGLTLLLEAFSALHRMHHEATACNLSRDIPALLQIITSILRAFRPREFAQGMETFLPPSSGDAGLSRVLTSSGEWPDTLRKLATLLNTYNPGELRASVVETLVEFLYVTPLDTLSTLTPLLLTSHTAAMDALTSGLGPTLGPYFPKRSSQLKNNIRPPKPMLQMAFPHLGQETAKGLDEDYDRELGEFYGGYHFLVDLMLRVGFMKEAVTPDLVTLSGMLGYEAAPLHFTHFPKLWLEVYNTPSIDRKYIQMLTQSSYFRDYVELVILEERSCLTNILIFNFLATYLPKVFDQISGTDQMRKALASISSDLSRLVEGSVGLDEIEASCVGILGDLKVLSLFYLPSVNGKGALITTPVPSPAPSSPQLKGTLQGLSNYLNKLLKATYQTQHPEPETGLSTSADEASTKRRKLDKEEAEQGVSKIVISRDLITLLVGTIDNLVCGMSTAEDCEEDSLAQTPTQSFSESKDGAEQKTEKDGKKEGK